MDRSRGRKRVTLQHPVKVIPVHTVTHPPLEKSPEAASPVLLSVGVSCTCFPHYCACARLLPTIPRPGAPSGFSLPSTGSRRFRFPRFVGTTEALSHPAAHPAALRFLRLTVPSEPSQFRSRSARRRAARAWGFRLPGDPARRHLAIRRCCDTSPSGSVPQRSFGPLDAAGSFRDFFDGDDRTSHVPGEPLVHLPCASTPSGPMPPRHNGDTDAALVIWKAKAPELISLRGWIARLLHWLSTLRRVRHLPRRKTRSGCRLGSTGWDFHPRVPAKGFRVTSCFSSSFPKHGLHW